MLTLKKKVVIRYLFLLVFFIIWWAFFCFKWLILAWMFFPIIPLFGYLTNPIPEAYRAAVRHSIFYNISLIIFSIAALFVAATSVLYPLSAKWEKNNTYVLFAALPFLIPFFVMNIREELKYAIKADAEASDKRGAN